MKSNSPPPFENLLANLSELTTSLERHQRLAAKQLSATVEGLIRSQSRDTKQIEQTLDLLLDCACVPEGLAAFKALCRHLYTIDPSAAAFHVNAYREMWDDEDT